MQGIIDTVMGNFQLYGWIAIAVIVAGVAFVLKMRGMKIDKLEAEVQEKIRRIQSDKQQAEQSEAVKVVDEEIADVVSAGEQAKVDTDAKVSDMRSDSFIEKVRIGL